jgi:hypothetical protein
MVERHRQERSEAFRRIETRERREALERAARLPKGFKGIWSRITGKFSLLKERNEFEALSAWQRDRAEKDALVSRQLDERQRLQSAIRTMREERAKELQEINREIAAYIAMKRGDVPKLDSFVKKKEAAKAKTKVQSRKKAEKDTTRQQAERIRERNRKRDQGPDFNR